MKGCGDVVLLEETSSALTIDSAVGGLEALPEEETGVEGSLPLPVLLVAGDLDFFGRFFGVLPETCCCACCRHLALRFLNHTCEEQTELKISSFSRADYGRVTHTASRQPTWMPVDCGNVY
ncbi:hypothetical protein RvY_19470 [Ramazzottius varieornatus]|uniref:Uncharacterized protein n=1 Tax=Ramazzottius varieornatus TaxID=947166 RepID=A0A1D1W9F8_RAMVA|nr:hypothetical protein RvY_19470 [Ramazzottius varieornatus]